jgi:hypothetical protein
MAIHTRQRHFTVVHVFDTQMAAETPCAASHSFGGRRLLLGRLPASQHGANPDSKHGRDNR